MITKPIPYGHQNINDDDVKAVIEALKSDFMTQGPLIGQFEKNFAEYFGCKYVCMVSNGTAALHLSAMALNIKPGDKVITSPITFVASANGFRYQGAEVVFCDIDPKTYLMDLNKLEQILKASPKGTYKAVVPVDFAGYPIDEERLRKLADEYGFAIVVDACHAPGGSFIDSKGEKQMIGNCKYADLTVFSFHPVKHIATGEGGAVTTNNKDLYEKVALYRTHGITKDHARLEKNDGGWYYEMQELGYNYRITEMQAALGISQLKRLDWSIERRNDIAKKYDEAFKGTIVKTPFRAEGLVHAFHLYIIQVDSAKRKGLYDFLRANNINSQVLYIPAHLMPYYRQFGWKAGDMPVAEDYYSKCLALPMFPTLTDEEQDWIIEKVKEFMA
ncbi:MAG: UDP-4-amino-4,6-dideoxy-N-acetyl-beta-L-altrosamine transaminase [Bacteroidaceae bacterium]|nr:UDP-4-amino-4,6-dideoxy-N-acetyl-beta-L-altrosamine transaminase [Bacteroidaceae bacterium]